MSEESPEKATPERSELEEAPESSTIPPTTTWQAIFAPQYNTYYFYNPVTQETTWTNPLQQPQPSTSIDPLEQQQPQPSSSSSIDPLPSQQPQPSTSSAVLHDDGIDPLLQHLESQAPSVPGSSGGDLTSFTARFNARTGQFTPATARQPGHLSEHERAKRMSEFYFDVEKWEQDLAKRGGRLMGEEEDPAGAEGTREKKRKRPSKKDLDRFKEQKKLKKIAKTAWLRT